MNLSVYGLGSEGNRKWLAVDLGVSFGLEEHLPGIDLIFPDIKFLIAERKNLLGLVITHAHEDHYGAVLDLWPKLKVPIFATPFTAALLAAKRAGEQGAPRSAGACAPRRSARAAACGRARSPRASRSQPSAALPVPVRARRLPSAGG